MVFSRFISFKVGHGNKVRFWKDWWCSDGALMDLFPTLYSIALNKEAVVADYLC